jgi:aromatic-amino-acid transaminase
MSLARLLQLASPALPVGAYTYSQGLEWAVEAGTVKEEATALRWIGDQLEWNLGRYEAPMLARMMAADEITLAELLAARGVTPLVDLAYQGLGRGLDADAYGTRRLVAQLPEVLVAFSCDKNFGLYRERVGALYGLARDADAAVTMRSNMAALARVNWSMPPDHGAAIVRTILESSELTALWRKELDRMGARVRAVRAALAAAEPRLAYLARQKGMFSTLPLAKPQIDRLRSEHAVYMAGSGRINLAGLQVADVPAFVAALAAVGFPG